MVSIMRNLKRRLLAALLLGSVCLQSHATDWTWQDLLLTRDQQAYILFQRQHYQEAARRFQDPYWRALALYAAEDFRSAADLWTQLPGAAALFNRGNALAHLKDYQGAADSYQLALQLQPEWPEAAANLALVQSLGREAKILDEYTAPSQGEMAADDFRFDADSKRMEHALEPGNPDTGTTSSHEIQAIWMQRLDSTPADFLSLKFRYQAEKAERENAPLPGEQP